MAYATYDKSASGLDDADIQQKNGKQDNLFRINQGPSRNVLQQGIETPKLGSNQSLASNLDSIYQKRNGGS